MGQGWVLQFCSAVWTPQLRPPAPGATRICLARVWMPPPHFSEQLDHPDQPESLQSMGQAKVLQVCTCLLMGQVLPPWAFQATTERVRDLVPVAQVAEHALK